MVVESGYESVVNSLLQSVAIQCWRVFNNL